MEGPSKSERFCQDRSELASRLDPIAPGAEGAGQLDGVGIVKGDAGLWSEVHSLLPLDQIVTPLTEGAVYIGASEGRRRRGAAINQEEAWRSLCPLPADSR